ncbi:hypothetical protein CEUSTIGMA_g3038.t1 [Chlamydomonas eustigma]|uniref:Piwi domain-containing protein n=1 Tax=Chlamydomonas eustigma TaxID=1157962 RepID=A0A250WXN5_9CHLO|nr:hypothetical protein CEUSTIGMA_g3038.t1 [Chlamydomonas eustigma]|eukprot:GAX75594.1 hypothetical protein CEUSTIGMA_g3038.t1 [Chlamydomonas eustigma]
MGDRYAGGGRAGYGDRGGGGRGYSGGAGGRGGGYSERGGAPGGGAGRGSGASYGAGDRGGGGRGGGGGRSGGGGMGGGEGVINPQDGANQLTAALKGLSIQGNKQVVSATATSMVMPKRPGVGSAGRGIKVLANYFRVDPNPQFTGSAVHYDVHICPVEDLGKKKGPADRPLPPKLCRKLIQALAKQNQWGSGWGFDGRKNLYAPTRFLPAETNAEIAAPENVEDAPTPQKKQAIVPAKKATGTKTQTSSDRKFQIVIREVAVVDTRYIFKYIKESMAQGSTSLADLPRDALQVLDVIVGWVSSNDPDTITAGRAFYFYSDNNHNLGGGVEAWSGYSQAFKATQAGLSLNIDIATSAFLRATPLVDSMAAMLDMRRPDDLSRGPLRPDALRKLAKGLYNVKVSIEGPSGVRRKTIRSVADKGANQLFFKDEKTGKSVSVADYFKSTGRPLRFSSLICVNVGPPQKPVYLPPEMCKVVEGQRRTKLDGRQTAEIIKQAAQTPKDKRGYIEETLAHLLPLSKDMLSAWGLTLQGSLSDVSARILPQPKLQYSSPACMDVGTQGSWNLRNVRFLEPRALTYWAVASMLPRDQAESQNPLQDFLKDLYSMLNSCGVTVAAKAPPTVYSTGRESVTQILEQALSAAKQAYGGKQPQLILVLLAFKEVPPYKDVKMFSDTVVGIPSQCFVAGKAGVGPGNFPKGRPQYTANLALKINTKLDGINARILGDPAKPAKFLPVIGNHEHFVVFGADVTHPAPGARNNAGERSIAAIVASRDRAACRFGSRMQLQEAGAEVIVDLEGAVRELLMTYYSENNKRKPTAILFYRDGVSEGQFKDVLKHEYGAIKKACLNLEQTYNPAVTFVVVQKRHNTRLLPKADGPSDRSGNVLPGTVVDTGICSPCEFDFFLNSHAGIQGTNKPAHYHVLVDEIGFGADGMQLLTYWLCYTYCRCTRSVSYCPPAYYAHLVAFRGRNLFAASSDSGSEVSGSSGTTPQFAMVHRDVQNRM